MPRIIDLFDPDGRLLADAPEPLRLLLRGFEVRESDRTMPFHVRLAHFGGWAFSSSEGGGHLDMDWRPVDATPLNYLILIMLGSGLVAAPQSDLDSLQLAKSRQAALYSPYALPDALHFAGSLRNTLVFLPADTFADLPLARPISTDFGLGAVMRSAIRVVESQAAFGWAQAMTPVLPAIATIIRQAFLSPGLEATSMRDGEDARLLRLQDFIHFHIDDPGLNARHAARACGLSLRQLHRVFERSGTSFATTVRHVRLERASALLASSPACVTIADVAAAVGYSDAAYFATAFRRHTGVPPSRWRLAKDASAETASR